LLSRHDTIMSGYTAVTERKTEKRLQTRQL